MGNIKQGLKCYTFISQQNGQFELRFDVLPLCSHAVDYPTNLKYASSPRTLYTEVSVDRSKARWQLKLTIPTNCPVIVALSLCIKTISTSKKYIG
jgi:hypothetical protein